MSLAGTFERSRQRTKAYRASASLALIRKAEGSQIVGPYGMAAGARMGGDAPFTSMAHHAEQYRYFRDWVYAALRPVLVRVATQSAKLGRRLRSAQLAKFAGVDDPRLLSAKGNEILLSKAPEFVRKQAPGLQIIEDHPLLDAFDDPNDIHVQWTLFYLTAANLCITGKGYWWMCEEDGRLRIWPLPSSWVRPDHSRGLFADWKVQSSGMSQATTVPGTDMAYFALPDPADPLGALGPLQAQARAVSTDEQIQKSQLQGYKNGLRPDVIFKVGRKPSLPGMPQGERPTLNPTQRRQLIEAVKLCYQGWEHSRDPMIVDGLIEEIFPYSRGPSEMDWMQSGKIIKERIFLGTGTNPISSGQVEGANRASSYVAEDSLIGNVVNPMIILLSQVGTKRISPRYAQPGEKLVFWIEEAKPHDVQLRFSQMKFAAEKGALTINEIREYLAKPPMKGKKYDLLPEPAKPAVTPGEGMAPTAPAARVVPPSQPPGPVLEGSQPTTTPDGQDKPARPDGNKSWGDVLGKEGRIVLWTKQQGDLETQVRAAADRVFALQLDSILTSLEANAESAFEVLSPEELAQGAFDSQEWVQATRDALWPVLERAVTAGALAELAMQQPVKASAAKLPKPVRIRIEAYLANLFNQPFWAEIQKAFGTRLIAALAVSMTPPIEGGIRPPAGVVIASVRKAMEASDSVKASELAVTESTGAVNEGHQEAIDHISVETGEPMGKMWFTVGDDKVRDSHAMLDGVRVARGEMFDVGGEMAPYPGSYMLSPAERYNCRCGIMGALLEEPE